jgi:hypothetical protein
MVTISPTLKLDVHDLRQVLRELGRAYHYLHMEYHADYCKRFVKDMRRDPASAPALPKWLSEAISRGFN